MMTADQARAALDQVIEDIKAGAPADKYATVLQSILVDNIDTTEKLVRALKKMREQVAALAQIVQGGGRVAAPAAGGGEAVGASGGAGAGMAMSTRVGADGQPLTPEQAALEEQMDAAAGPRPPA